MSHRLRPLTILAFSWAITSHSAYAASPAQWQILRSQVTISLEQAVHAATQAVPGQVIEIEIDDGDGAGPRYEAEVISTAGDSVEVWVDAASGVARLHETDGKAKRKDVQRLQEATITLTQAVQSALAHTAGQAVKAELDSHWGQPRYEVDVLQADHTVMQVQLNATTGQVLHSKKD